jgi:hypothetical protein
LEWDVPFGHSMVLIHSSLFNFSAMEILQQIFSGYSNDFEFTARGVFRRSDPPICTNCGCRTIHNGYNHHTKMNLGRIKIGRYQCPNCELPFEEDRGFWEDLKNEFSSKIDEIYRILKLKHLSYETISEVMDLIFPRSKSTVFREHNEDMSTLEIDPVTLNGDIIIMNYDEQFPKQSRNQKYRLTLIDSDSGRAIAEELFSKFDDEVLKSFLTRHVDTSKTIFITTDMNPSYPIVFDEIFGDKIIHQWCLFHLNKRIVQHDFPRSKTMNQILTMYRLLGIFYNRDDEVAYLRHLVMEENLMIDDDNYDEWLNNTRSEFWEYIHESELRRRREKKNLPMRTHDEAKKYFQCLMLDYNMFDGKIQKRLRKIQKYWEKFTAFHSVEGAPATNNRVENYYSISLKTHRKNQLRTDIGIENHLKLIDVKKCGTIRTSNGTLLEIYSKFQAFLAPG